MAERRSSRRTVAKTRVASTSGAAMSKRLGQLEAQVKELVRARARRKEPDGLLSARRQLEQHTRDLDLQFKRIAQLQAELDEIKRAWEKMKSLT